METTKYNNETSPIGDYLQIHSSFMSGGVRERAGSEALCVGKEMPPAFASLKGAATGKACC